MRIIKTISAQNGLVLLNPSWLTQHNAVTWIKRVFTMILLMGCLTAQAATPPNTELLNTVFVEYQVGKGAPVSMQASERTVTTDRTPAQIDFYTVFILSVDCPNVF